jgi:hypothetical protein
MVSAGAARCSPAEGQGRNGVPAGRQYAVIGGAALLPCVGGRVLLFSAKALLERHRVKLRISAANRRADIAIAPRRRRRR